MKLLKKFTALVAVAFAAVGSALAQSPSFNEAATQSSLTAKFAEKMAGVEGLMWGAALLGIGIFFIRIILNVIKGGVKAGVGR